MQVNALPKPVPMFENTTVCSGSPTFFTADKSTNAAYYGWNFGDKTPLGTGKNISHTYAKAGVYPVKLYVMAAGNCLDSLQQLVTVNDKPIANFIVLSEIPCSYDSVLFSDQSTFDPATNVSYLYSFNDGTTSALPNPSHLYTQPGFYEVTLIVSSADNCKSSVSNYVTVYGIPKADFTVLDVCESDSARFIDASTVSNSTIDEYDWFFDFNGAQSNEKVPIAPDYPPGKYNVTLNVTSMDGCHDGITKTLTVFPKVISEFTSTDVCLGDTTIFSNKSKGPYIQSEWKFADGIASSVTSPTHLYKSSKTYPVVLTVTSTHNCKSSYTMNVNVNDLPKIKFDAPNVCINIKA